MAKQALPRSLEFPWLFTLPQRRDMCVFASIFLLCFGSTSTHFNINSVEVSQRLLADYMTAH